MNINKDRIETWIETNEMRMLGWVFGVTKKDKIRNEYIRGTTRIVQRTTKDQVERCL